MASPRAGAGSPSPSGEYARFAVWVVGCGIVLTALGYLPTRRMAGEGALGAMYCAVSAVTLGSIIGGLPIFLAHLKGVPNPQAGLISMLVRLVAVVLLATLLALSLGLPTGPFLIWLALAYLLLLVVDTRYAMVVLRSL